MKRNYDEAFVVRVLSKKKDLRIDSAKKTVEVVKESSEIGNGSWGKIDYLSKAHGYVVLFVSKNAQPAKRRDGDGGGKPEKRRSKAAKRESKMNKAPAGRNAARRAKAEAR